MTTVFEQLAAVGSGSVDVKVSVQVTNLGTIATTIGDLVAHPPQGIDDLLGAVRTLPLPDLSLGHELPAALTSLSAAIPTDLSSVTGDLSGSIDAIATTMTADLVASISAGLAPILALHKALELDHACLTTLGSATAPAAPPPAQPPPAEPPPPAPPASPPAAARAAAAIDGAMTSLVRVPSPLTIEALLRVLAAAMATGDPGPGGRRPVPVFDDLGEGLATLLRWNDAPDQILASLDATLDQLAGFVSGSVDAAFGTLAVDAGAVALALTASPLAAVADGLTTRLGELSAATTPAEAETAAQAIDDLMNTLGAALGGGLTSSVLDRLDALGRQLESLSGELEDQLGHVVAVLAPPVSLPSTFPGPDPIIAVDDEMVEAMRGLVSPIVGWLQDLAMKLDLSSLTGPITSAAGAATSALDEVDTAIAAVTSDVQQLFAKLEGLLDELDSAAIATQFEAALGAFQKAFAGQLAALFSPVRSLLGTAIEGVSEAVAAFDPATISAALESVIGELAGVLGKPEVADAREQIEAAFAGAEKAVGALSFTPVTDPVVAVIEEITAALKALDPSILSAPLQLALQGAVMLLPSDLDPVTHPLLEEMQALVDAGPGALVEQVRAPLAQLQDAIHRFEPAGLVGDTLGAPFDAAVAQLEAFTPSHLLEPVGAELERVKDRLHDEVSPQRLLAPLQAPFAALMAAFAQLDPDAVVKPLEEAIQQTVAAILDAVPIDELLAPVGAVLDAVQGIIDVGHNALALVHKGSDLLAGLDDGPAKVQAFADGVLEKLATTVDAASLQPHVDAVGTAVAGTTQQALGDRATAATGSLTAALGAVAPRDRLAALSLAHRAVKIASPSPLVAKALQRADPLKPELAAPYQALAAFQRRATDAGQAFELELAEASKRRHAAGGTLDAVALLEATPESLVGWIRDALQPQVVNPLRALFAPTAPILKLLAPIVSEVEALMATLTSKLAAFGTASGSAGNIKHTVEQLVDRLKGVDLAFLSTSLGELFDRVRSKLEAIGPAALAPVLDKAFDDALATLDVSSLLPKADIDKLDAGIVSIVTALQAVDPKHLVEKLQPIFDDKVLPLIEAFDLGGLLDALLQTLHGLHDELDGELERVNTAYKAMLAAVPPFNPLSIDIDIDVDVGGFL